MSEENNNNVKENGFFDRPDPLERYTPDGNIFPNMKEKKAKKTLTNLKMKIHEE